MREIVLYSLLPKNDEHHPILAVLLNALKKEPLDVYF